MTDAEAAAILSDWLRLDYEFAFERNRDKRVAIERAIELLEREANQVNYRDIVPPWAIDEGNPPHDPRR